ncbi:MAG: HTH domain-containing protein [Gammaproteobacteria bacterium]|nr:HTH domain-containing protein [Gammaproteobacteria bacterium]
MASSFQYRTRALSLEANLVRAHVSGVPVKLCSAVRLPIHFTNSLMWQRRRKRSDTLLILPSPQPSPKGRGRKSSGGLNGYTQTVADAPTDVGVNVGVSDQVLELLRQTSHLSAKEMGTLLNKTPRTIERHLKALREQGRIRRVASDKTGHWKISRRQHKHNRPDPNAIKLSLCCLFCV